MDKQRINGAGHLVHLPAGIGRTALRFALFLAACGRTELESSELATRAGSMSLDRTQATGGVISGGAPGFGGTSERGFVVSIGGVDTFRTTAFAGGETDTGALAGVGGTSDAAGSYSLGGIAGTLATECTDGSTLCDGQCVNTRWDAKHCGSCERACSAVAPSWSQCVDSRCRTTLAFKELSPGSIAVDGTAVYWTSGSTTGSIKKIPLEGGSPITLAADQNDPEGLILDASNVYWINGGDHTVMKISLEGGAPITLASEQGSPMALAVDSTSIYWTDRFDGSVRKVSLSGGTPILLTSNQSEPRGIVVDASSIYWVNAGVDQGSSPDGSVMTMPLAGGVPVALAIGQSHPGSIALDSNYVYWTNAYYVGAVMKISITGDKPATLAGTQNGPGRIVVDETDAYWVSSGLWSNPTEEAKIMRIGLKGGPATVILLGTTYDYIAGFAMDASNVYWTQSSSGTVMKLTPN